MTDQHEVNQDQRITDLEARLAQVEEALVASNNVVTQLQGQIIEVCASHVNRLFQDQVLLDSIAQRMLIAGANAIAYKAKHSRQKAPELIVLEGYLPGAIRVTLKEEGAFIEMEEKEKPGSWLSGADLPQQFQASEMSTIFGELLISYGAELGKTYFVMESADVEAARDKAQNAAMALTDLGGKEDQATSESAQAELVH